jgi:hypothetical protein
LYTALLKVEKGRPTMAFKNAIQNSEHGFLIHNRFANFPPQLIYDLHRNLHEDIKWAQSVNLDTSTVEQDLEKDVIMKFKQMKKCHLLVPCTFSESSSKGSLQQLTNVTGWNDIILHCFEDDIYFQHAEEAFYVNLPNEDFKHRDNILLIIKIENFDIILSELKKMLL